MDRNLKNVHCSQQRIKLFCTFSCNITTRCRFLAAWGITSFASNWMLLCNGSIDSTFKIFSVLIFNPLKFRKFIRVAFDWTKTNFHRSRYRSCWKCPSTCRVSGRVAYTFFVRWLKLSSVEWGQTPDWWPRRPDLTTHFVVLRKGR